MNQTDLLTWWSSNVAENMLESTNNNIGQPSGSRAFVLDDEPQIGALVCKVLQACGLAPRQFTTPEQFLAELKASPPELVVLDLSLGHFDAVEIIRHLEIDKYRGKVILVSGRDEATLNEITLIGKKHGLAMLPPLRKPFRPGDVKQRLSIHMADTVRAKHRSSEPTAALP